MTNHVRHHQAVPLKRKNEPGDTPRWLSILLRAECGIAPYCTPYNTDSVRSYSCPRRKNLMPLIRAWLRCGPCFYAGCPLVMAKKVDTSHTLRQTQTSMRNTPSVVLRDVTLPCRFPLCDRSFEIKLRIEDRTTHKYFYRKERDLN